MQIKEREAQQLWVVLGIAKQKNKVKELNRLIKTLKDFKFYTLKELSENLNIQYKTLFKYINELKELQIIETQKFDDYIRVKLNKNFKLQLKRIVKELVKNTYEEIEKL